ncbi:MAG: membrane-bound lytic murein transglycosylase MltF [Halothiobacillaceae bacterium]|nr:membrane-bound lytic murein transglycosylase MltF [Halothiobacillaceae bacterium]
MTSAPENHPNATQQPWWLRLLGVGGLVLIPLLWWLATYPPSTPLSLSEDAALSQSFAKIPQLDQIKARGYLRVATLISPTIYIPDKTQPQGLEYDLVTRFAHYLGLGVHFIVAKNIDEAYALVASNQADFAAAGLVVSLGREVQFRYGPSYLSVRRQLIYRQGVEKPKSLQDIGNAPLAVEQGSNSQNWLTEQSNKGLLDVPFSSLPEATPPKTPHEKPDYAIRIQLEDSGINTLQALENGTVDYAVVLSHEAMLGQKMSNKIRVATDLGPPVSFAWAFARVADHSLYNASVHFFSEIRQNNELKNLIDRHYAQFEQLDQKLAQQFVDDVDQRISPYLSAFKAAGKKYHIDWRLLAAMGYQESKWQPDAQSQQGAYGMMQIMPPTAAYIGLTDPGNPVQNITAAAKYLDYLRSQIDDQAPEPDLTYLALAAYNIGIGHLNDAIKLTRQQGGDPNRWRDIRERLAQLSNPKIYPKLRNGYARGEETIQYVENIRALHDLMIWVEIHNQKIDGTFGIDSSVEAN